jgi:inosose dehydratase
MNAMRFGCQTYTWQMSFEKYRGQIDHIVSVVRASGMRGVEPELCMLGDFATDPVRLRDCLAANQVALGALSLVCAWEGPRETPEETALADSTLALLRDYFPGTALVLCQALGPDRRDLARRQKNVLACLGAVGARARAAGVTAAFHPNSPAPSLFRVADDYGVLLDGLAREEVGFAPDAGHIAKGGMDPVRIFEQGAGLIRHVHFKDMSPDGSWALMGRGCIDFRGIVGVLGNSGYRGWIMVEDESPLAETDPDAATLLNGRYIADTFPEARPFTDPKTNPRQETNR